MLGVPVDLSKVDVDTYVVAGIADHLTPWQNCYRSTRLLGGDSRFVLSTSGHIAALVNPPGNPKASYQVNEDNPADPREWLPDRETACRAAGGRTSSTWLGRALRRREGRHPSRARRWRAASRWSTPPAPTSSTAERSGTMYEDIGKSLGTDYFRIADQLTAEELDYLRRAREFVDDEVLPVINGYWERAEFPWPLIQTLGKLGIVGDGIEGYGCPPMSPIATGLIHMELNRGDGSLGTFLGVQAGLAMQSIAMLGSEEQKQRWLPGMAALETLGAFALTEPTHGSDSVALETAARRDGDDWVINGQKKWIGNGTLADVVVRLGPRHRRRAGQGVPGREGHARLRRTAHRRQGVAARGVAGRDHPHRPAGAGGEPAARREQLQGHRPGARRHPQLGRLGGARPRHRGVRDRRRLLRSSASSSASRW